MTHCAKDLGILVDSSLSLTAQIHDAVAKSRGILDFIKYTYKKLTPHVCITLDFAIVAPHLEYYVQT